MNGLTDSGFSFLQVVRNLADEAGHMSAAAAAVAYVLGFVFLISALLLAKESANPAARASHRSSAWFWSLTFSSLMFALPTTIASVSTIFFGPSSTTDLTFSYVQDEAKPLAPLVPLLKLIGVIAVIRGLVILRAVGVYGNYARGNATLGRGLTLVLAGVAAVHMRRVLGLFSSITGLDLGANLF